VSDAKDLQLQQLQIAKEKAEKDAELNKAELDRMRASLVSAVKIIQEVRNTNQTLNSKVP
jgi:hypothetical protein